MALHPGQDIDVHAAAAAMDLLYPYEKNRRPEVAAPAGATVLPATAEQARHWLDIEEGNLVAAATQPDRPRHTADIAMILWRHLHVNGHTTLALLLHREALAATRALQDPAGEVHALNRLGGAYWKSGRIAEALEHFQQALTVARGIDDRANEGRTLNNIGIIYERQRRLTEALDHYRRALVIARELDDAPSQGRALNDIGAVLTAQGSFTEAPNPGRFKVTSAAGGGGERG